MTLDEATTAVRELADSHGWRSRVCGASESTVSVYIMLSRAVVAPDDTPEDIENYGPTGLEEVRVRISDHGNAHSSYEEQWHVRLDGDAEADLGALTQRLSL